ncbi:MAG: glycosyltransferase family 4 protein [Chloroflexi bacterium]|nr:glycosyltransferase family 4 protein [Chloroflexota bacterium]
MKLFIVTPWYPPHAGGGAELLAQRAAALLQAAGHDVCVLTTCVREFRSDWGIDHYRPGRAVVGGVPVRRFSADRRDWRLFDQVNLRLMRGEQVTPAEEAAYVEESVRSRALEAFIAAQSGDARFVLLPYMFGTTYWGAQVRPQDSFLMPCLHDEAYARLSVFAPIMRAVRGLLCLSEAERELAGGLYGVSEERLHIVGAAIDLDVRGDAARFRARFGLRQPFLLYAGRKDAGKNLDWLCDAYARYVAHRDDLRLVLIGPGTWPAPPGLRGRLIDLGFVAEQDKYDACAAALAVCQPSLHESFSYVVMEGWLCGTPALVHADCAVTVEHCRAAGAGLWCGDAAEFAASVDCLREHADVARRLGAQGAAYVRRAFAPAQVQARLERALAT